ncbi:L,D-transpeptidase [Streptomyces sp. NPDC059991]|uniref:L,D-transpeptidase n=1 Tax=Streptomyces sp. NPDC059991 TaxID=3347028 RepID=UPI0036A9597D
MWKFPRARRTLRALIPAAPLALTVGVLPAYGVAVAAPTPGSAPLKCSTADGPYQREVEELMGLEADGSQSPADCLAIQRYQESQLIVPADGSAGPITYTALYWEWAQNYPEKLRGCPQRMGRVACVDLGHQIMWVALDGKVVFTPVAIRSGRAELPTRTGWFHVEWRKQDDWSTLYNSPMTFSQYFSGGQAIHGVYNNLYEGSGSHGCVNLRHEDAKRLWTALQQGDAVYVWGRKPGA